MRHSLLLSFSLSVSGSFFLASCDAGHSAFDRLRHHHKKPKIDPDSSLHACTAPKTFSFTMGNHKKRLHFLRADPAASSSSPKSFSSSASDDDGCSSSSCNTTDGYASAASSPSRYSASTPPKSPWAHLPGLGDGDVSEAGATGLIASLVKEDGHVYSLAVAGNVLYTGTDSENVRVWRDRRELAGFRTGSGLVKAIVVADDGRIFTGHQDGKVRVWRADADDPTVHRRVGSLPRLADFLKSSVNPSSYVEMRRGRRARAVWLRHSDAVSCLSLDEGAGLLYSGSWDRTFKVWRVSDSKCLESVRSHDDAVNTVAAASFDNVVFTGSADGTVKVWRREAAEKGNATRHVLERVLRKGESSVTAIAVSPEDRVVYVGSSDGLVTFWHWIHGEARYGGVLKGHKMAVMCLAVAGDVVVSGSADRTLCVWRREGAEHVRLAVLDGHTGPIKCVAMDEEESDGERWFVVYSGSLDGSVKVWRLADDATGRADSTNNASAGVGGAGVVTVPDVGDQACGSCVRAKQSRVRACTNNAPATRVL